MDERTKLYSWKDVERYFLLNKEVWKDQIASVECYPSYVVYHPAKESRQSEYLFDDIFTRLFGRKYVRAEGTIQLDLDKSFLPVYCDTDEDDEDSLKYYHNPVKPLFESVLYHESAYPDQPLNELPCKVIAFHSYKGGVGRTLSLVAFAKAWAEVFSKGNKQDSSSLLIVDGDIEAPGLSWLQKNSIDTDTFSYLDLLSLVQDSTDINRTVDLACSKITATFNVETPERTVKHIFIPTYRYKEQWLDMYASPETIINRKGFQYILAEVLSKICKQLNLGGVLVDLRAGLSEFSSTLLFDPRVKKYITTSTSAQSVMGTEIILDCLMKGFKIDETTVIPEIFLNMVPRDLPDGERNDIIERFQSIYEKAILNSENQTNNVLDSKTDNAITELPFASELIHQPSLNHILQSLQDRILYKRIRDLVRLNYSHDESENRVPFNVSQRPEILKQIHDWAHSQLVAESGSGTNMLLTEPLKNLGARYRDYVPSTVILGAKGAGKTFLYHKMLRANRWDLFYKEISPSESTLQNCYFFPVIAPANMGNLLTDLNGCILTLKESVRCVNPASNSYFAVQDRVRNKIESNERIDASTWEEIFCSALNPNIHDFSNLDEELYDCDCRVIFLIDGLEEVFSSISSTHNHHVQQEAIRSLCQELVNKIHAQCRNIGIITFLRRDLARNAIPVNYTQFENVYQDVALRWSADEALRLAVWVVEQAFPKFYQGPNGTGIDIASQKVIAENLERLWGLKLGLPSSNEAYSSNWILAALSDFNGQLQARDIIRFLDVATNIDSVTPRQYKIYNDRILMPAEIRAAIPKCSKSKMQEITQEYMALSVAFKKFEDLPEDKKKVPISPEDVSLTKDEEDNLISEGFLKITDKGYYVPEIIRSSLNLIYGHGARPKVLALMPKRKPGNMQ